MGGQALQPTMKTAGKPATRMAGKRFGKQKMKGRVRVTDNDWSNKGTRQPGIDELNFSQPRRREKTSYLVIPETIVQWGA